MPSNRRITVEMYLDTVCPWCYVGKRSLDAAVEAYKAQNIHNRQVEFDVVYRPFYLSAGKTTHGRPGNTKAQRRSRAKREIYFSRRAPDERAQLEQRIADAGRRYGIAWNWEGELGSSRASHCLLRLARERAGGAAAGRLLDEIFRGAFERGRNVADLAFLQEAAVTAGVDVQEEDLKKFLCEEGGDDTQGRLVDEEARAAREDEEISAVPMYVVQGRWRIGGMQEVGVFARLFDRALGEQERSRI